MTAELRDSVDILLSASVGKEHTCQKHSPVGILIGRRRHSVHGDVTVDADRDEANNGKRQQVVADEECDEDSACCRNGGRHTDVPFLRAGLHQSRAIHRQYRRVDDRHADPDCTDRKQDIASSSQPA